MSSPSSAASSPFVATPDTEAFPNIVLTSMAGPQDEQSQTPSGQSIYFLDLVIIRGKHDPLSREVRLCVPESYKPIEARAMFAHSEHEFHTHQASASPALVSDRQFVELPVWWPTDRDPDDHAAGDQPQPHTLHIDLSSDVLCLNNLEDPHTLAFLPRGATLPALIPALHDLRHLALPWTGPDAFPLACKRCHAECLPEFARRAAPLPCVVSRRRPRCNATPTTTTTMTVTVPTTRASHTWRPAPPEDVLALWPAHFPRLQSLYLVVDSGRFPAHLRLRDDRVQPDVLLEFRAPHGTCYDVFSDEGAWEEEEEQEDAFVRGSAREGVVGAGGAGPRRLALVMQRWYIERCRDLSRDVPRCAVLGLVRGERGCYF